MKTTSMHTGLTALLLLAACATQAAPIELRWEGFANGFRTGTIFGPGVGDSANVRAGQFRFDVENDLEGVFWDSKLEAFCIDVTETLVTNDEVVYEFSSAADSGYLTPTQLANIAWLWDHRADALGSPKNDAAFQLALWEVMYDSDPLSLLSGGNQGNFWSTSFNGARSLAQNWLLDLSIAGPSDSYVSSSFDFFVLLPSDPVNNQTLILAKPVPEPSVIALFGLGLLGVAVMRRRRASSGLIPVRA